MRSAASRSAFVIVPVITLLGVAFALFAENAHGPSKPLASSAPREPSSSRAVSEPMTITQDVELATVVSPPIAEAQSTDRGEVDRNRARAIQIVEDRFRARAGQRYDVGKLASDFARLAALADAGDFVAARTLFENLDQCSRSQTSPEEWAIASAKSEAAMREAKTPQDVDDRITSDAIMLAEHAHCDGVTETLLAQRIRFGEQLAAAGDSIARLQYLEFAFPLSRPFSMDIALPPFRERGLGYLREEVRRGNTNALTALAYAYREPKFRMVDEARSYVYLYAAAQKPGLHSHSIEFWGLASLTDQFTPDQRAAMEAEGVAIYQSCCVNGESTP